MRFIWPVAISCLFVAGCTPPGTEINSLREKVAELETELLLLKYAEDPLEARVTTLEGKVGEPTKSNPITLATLTPGSNGYSVAQTPMGPFLVSLGDMEVRGKGSKVVIAIGNLTAARFQGVDLTVIYGADKSSEKAGKAFTVEYAFPGDLPAGAWTPATVTLPDLKPEELGTIQVLVSPSVVNMR